LNPITGGGEPAPFIQAAQVSSPQSIPGGLTPNKVVTGVPYQAPLRFASEQMAVSHTEVRLTTSFPLQTVGPPVLVVVPDAVAPDPVAPIPVALDSVALGPVAVIGPVPPAPRRGCAARARRAAGPAGAGGG
jgi:hypothetical protein